MKKGLFPVLFFLFLVSSGASASSLANYSFSSPEEEKAFRDLTAELRCLVCQNQNLADSDAELADDLRREVYELFKAGKSKEEITGFLTARYGDFVLYDPPLKPSTYALWFGPLLMLLVGGALLYRTLRRKSDSAETDLSEEELQRLNTLLKESSDKQDSDK